MIQKPKSTHILKLFSSLYRSHFSDATSLEDPKKHLENSASLNYTSFCILSHYGIILLRLLVDYLRVEGAKQSPEKRTMGFRWLWLFTAVRNLAAPPTGSSWNKEKKYIQFSIGMYVCSIFFFIYVNDKLAEKDSIITVRYEDLSKGERILMYAKMKCQRKNWRD